jgi:hypothetical protein
MRGRTADKKNPRKWNMMQKRVFPLLAIGLLLVAACSKGADRTDEAIAAVNTIVSEADRQVQALTAAVADVKDAAAVVGLIASFRAAIVDMMNRIQGLEKDFPVKQLDRKRMQELSKTINSRTVEIGKPFGAALAKLPVEILSSDEVRTAIGQLEAIVK